MASSNLENNKIFGAVLIAGIVAMLAGFVSDLFVHAEELEEDAYPIVVAQADTKGGASAETAAPAGPESIDDLLVSADAAVGEKIVKACAACHSFDQGGPNKIGPNLYGVFNNDIGVHEGFKYSKAMKEKGGVWDVAALNHYLWKPKDYVPGTKMTYVGLKKPEDRAAVIKYLQTLE